MPTERFINTNTLTPYERISWDRGIAYRGYFIEIMFQLESRLEEIINIFLGANNDEDIHNLLNFYLYKEGGMSLYLKHGTAKQITQIKLFKNGDYTNYFTLVFRLIELRNIIAHFGTGYENTKGASIIYMKPGSQYKGGKDNDDTKRWIPEKTVIYISDQIEKEIDFQLTISGAFLLFICDMLKPESEREYKTPIDRMNEVFLTIDQKFIADGGVFKSGLKK